VSRLRPPTFNNNLDNNNNGLNKSLFKLDNDAINKLIMNKKQEHNIAYNGQCVLGSLLRSIRFAHYTTQATQNTPPYIHFRRQQAKLTDTTDGRR